MKLAVIGPKTTAGAVEEVIRRELPDVKLLLCCYDHFEEVGEIAADVQNRHLADALLFTGRSIYQYARKRTAPSLPWEYLPHNRISLFQALFHASAVLHCPLDRISADCYEKELLSRTLSDVGVTDTSFLLAPYGEETPDWEQKLLEFHRTCYRSGRVSLCVTCMEHILEPLTAEGIPCVRVYPAREIIREQVYRLQLLTLSAQENRGRLAVIAIHFDYVFDDEQNLSLREWEKMKYQNEFKERVYETAQRLQASVFGGGYDQFFIVTTRDMLQNGFLKNHEHARLMQFGRRSHHYKIWLGIGVGDSMLEAQSRAAMALNRSMEVGSGSSYLAESESAPRSTPEEYDDAVYSLHYLADQTGLSPASLKRLAAALPEDHSPVTSASLAAAMNLTVRSVNRILEKLERAGYAVTVGKESAAAGRPARLLRVTLPKTSGGESG